MLGRFPGKGAKNKLLPHRISNVKAYPVVGRDLLPQKVTDQL
jgi:hypothetical protein